MLVSVVNWLPVAGLVIAAWGLTITVSAARDSRLFRRLYEFDKRHSRVGPIKIGVFAFSDNIAVYRICVSLIGSGLVVAGLLDFIYLR